MARIRKNPQAPGGWEREFAPKANGQYCFMWPENWNVGDDVEFGADYYSARGIRHPLRWRGKILEIHENYIILEGKEVKR